MRKLPKPAYRVKSVFIQCANNFQDTKLTARLLSVTDDVETAETDYEINGDRETLYTIPEENSVATLVSIDEMEKLYTRKLSKKGSVVRPIYDALKISARICPLCGIRTVTQLDHYLPKRKHPSFAVTPLNLVPSCTDCNKDKLTHTPSTAGEQTLHPYFDDFTDAIWLQAEVVECIPPAIIFSVVRPSTWPETKFNRMKMHFKTLGLGALYSTNAGAELTAIRFSLLRIVNKGDSEQLKEHFMEQAEDFFSAEKNSWRAAMYKALYHSDWFCTHGYMHIAD